MIRRVLVAAAFSALGQLIGCAWLSSGSYGAALTTCTEFSKTATEAEACCADVAKQRGRDASYCYVTDAGDAQ